LSKQSKPANPSDLLTHPAVVHAIKQAARRLSRLSVFRRVDREDIMADLRLEVAIRLQVFDPALSSIGTFSTKERDARLGRNPRTGAKVDVDEKRVPYFKAGKEIRERLNVKPVKGKARAKA